MADGRAGNQRGEFYKKENRLAMKASVTALTKDIADKRESPAEIPYGRKYTIKDNGAVILQSEKLSGAAIQSRGQTWHPDFPDIGAGRAFQVGGSSARVQNSQSIDPGITGRFWLTVRILLKTVIARRALFSCNRNKKSRLFQRQTLGCIRTAAVCF